LIFQRLVLKLAYGPVFQLEDKAKLKPINWLSTNTIWSANFSKHWALAKIVRPKPSTSKTCIHKSRKLLRGELRNNKRMVIREERKSSSKREIGFGFT